MGLDSAVVVVGAGVQIGTRAAAVAAQLDDERGTRKKGRGWEASPSTLSDLEDLTQEGG